MNLHKSRNDLDSNTKASVCALLNARLVDAIDLALATKQAHWNLRGRQFIAVHEMFDGFRTEIDAHDWLSGWFNLAERLLVQLKRSYEIPSCRHIRLILCL